MTNLLDTTSTENNPDRHFNPFRIPRTAKAQSLLKEVIGRVLELEGYYKLRKRRRSHEDHKAFERIVTAIICDLIHVHLTTPAKLIYITQSKRMLGLGGRYTSPVMSEVLPDILKRLGSPDLALVVMDKGKRGFDSRSNKQTTITVGQCLVSLISEHDLELSDLMQDCTQESIVLKGSKEDHFDKGKWVEYTDTEITNQYREELLKINQWLAQANIQCDLGQDHPKLVDDSDRLLKRYFSNGSFESGGRLFGGFWQGLSKAERKEGIYIDDEYTSTLDYSQATPRMAYGFASAALPESDAYTLPSNRYNRKDIKKIFSAMIYADKPLKRFPKGTRESFERNVRFSEISTEILSYHQPIAHLFGIGIGLKLMFLESQILIRVLVECMKEEIVALPVHDALIVSKSNQAKVRDIMLRAFHEVAMIEGKVEIEG